MENNRDEKQRVFDRNALMLTEEDIDTLECYRHLLPEQKLALITFVYEISLVLYNSYSKNDEPS